MCVGEVTPHIGSVHTVTMATLICAWYVNAWHLQLSEIKTLRCKIHFFLYQCFQSQKKKEFCQPALCAYSSQWQHSHPPTCFWYNRASVSTGSLPSWFIPGDGLICCCCCCCGQARALVLRNTISPVCSSAAFVPAHTWSSDSTWVLFTCTTNSNWEPEDAALLRPTLHVLNLAEESLPFLFAENRPAAGWVFPDAEGQSEDRHRGGVGLLQDSGAARWGGWWWAHRFLFFFLPTARHCVTCCSYWKTLFVLQTDHLRVRPCSMPH